MQNIIFLKIIIKLMQQGPIEKAKIISQDQMKWAVKIQRKREVANQIMGNIIRQFQQYQQNDVEIDFDPWAVFEERYRQFYNEEDEKRERRERRIQFILQYSERCLVRFNRYLEAGGLRKMVEYEEEEYGSEGEKTQEFEDEKVPKMIQQILHMELSQNKPDKNESFSILEKTKQLQKSSEIHQQHQEIEKIQQPKIQQDEDEEEAVVSATQSGTKPKNKKKNRTRAQKKARIQARNNADAEATRKVRQRQAQLLLTLQFERRQGLGNSSLRDQFVEPTKQEIQSLTEGKYTSIMKAHVLNKFTAILLRKMGLKLEDWSEQLMDVEQSNFKIDESKESFIQQLICPVSFLLKKNQTCAKTYSKQLTENTRAWIMRQLDRVVEGIKINTETQQFGQYQFAMEPPKKTKTTIKGINKDLRNFEAEQEDCIKTQGRTSEKVVKLIRSQSQSSMNG